VVYDIIFRQSSNGCLIKQNKKFYHSLSFLGVGVVARSQARTLGCLLLDSCNNLGTAWDDNKHQPLILYPIHRESGMIHFESLSFFSRLPAAARKIVSSPVFDATYRDFCYPTNISGPLLAEGINKPYQCLNPRKAMILPSHHKTACRRSHAYFSRVGNASTVVLAAIVTQILLQDL